MSHWLFGRAAYCGMLRRKRRNMLRGTIKAMKTADGFVLHCGLVFLCTVEGSAEIEGLDIGGLNYDGLDNEGLTMTDWTVKD